MLDTPLQSFESLMAEGHQSLQSERNDKALESFKSALKAADGSNEQNAEALHMSGLALRKIGMPNRALNKFYLAQTFATSRLQLGRIARDIGMAHLDMGEYDKASADLRISYDHLERSGEPTEAAATLGFQGRVALKRGDFKQARLLMRQADAGLTGNPVYALNNLIWLMLASPIRRWLLLPKVLQLVVRYPANRTVGALARVLASLGGMRMYDAVRAKKSR